MPWWQSVVDCDFSFICFICCDESFISIAAIVISGAPVMSKSVMALHIQNPGFLVD